MLYGSEIWWTGAIHNLGQTAPTYKAIARINTGLPRWTPIGLLHTKAGIPSLDLLLSRNSMRYGIRILLAANDHLCNPYSLAASNPEQQQSAQTAQACSTSPRFFTKD